MPPLPPGVTVDGDRIRVDLRFHPVLAERDGVLVLPALRLILVRGRQKIRAFRSSCPHKPARDRPVVQTGDGGRPRFVCPHHDWTWDHRGRPTGCAEARLDRYETAREGDVLVVVRR